MIDEYGYIVQYNKILKKPDMVGDSAFFMAIDAETKLITGLDEAVNIYKKVVLEGKCNRHPTVPEYQRDAAKKFNQINQIYKLQLPNPSLGVGLGMGKAQGIFGLRWFQERPFKNKNILDNVYLLGGLGILFIQVLAFELLPFLVEGFYSIHLAFIDYDVICERNKIGKYFRLAFYKLLKMFGHTNQYMEYRCRLPITKVDYEFGGCEYSFQRDMRIGSKDRELNNWLDSHLLDKSQYEAIWNSKNTLQKN